MAGQMERREYVSLIDVVGAEAGWRWWWWGGVECVKQNSAKITGTSAVHLQRSH